MMSEHEYEEWFDKYLGDVESTLKTENTSQISNIPRPFNAKRWAGINVIILILALLGSLLFAGYNSVHPQWYFEWGCNALLNMFFGLLVSLLIFIYTNLRERNITYYTDVCLLYTSDAADD